MARWNSINWADFSPQTRSPRRSGGGAGKGRRACNYVSGIWVCIEKVDAKCWLYAEMTSIMTSLPFARTITCFAMFVYIRASFRFPLIGGNLTVQSAGSHKGIGGRIQIPETLLQADSFFFPPHCQSAPGSFLASVSGPKQYHNQAP